MNQAINAFFDDVIQIDLVQRVVHTYFEYAVVRGGGLYISLNSVLRTPYANHPFIEQHNEITTYIICFGIELEIILQ